MGKDNKNSQGPENQKKILMIDDSDSALEIMELYVESEFDNPIITATNGNEAIDILKKSHEDISVIICDYNMPKGDGGDVFQYVNKNTPDIPFILVCGEDPHTLKSLPKLDGLFEDKKVLPVVPKPFRKDGLVQAVKYIKNHGHVEQSQSLKKIHLNRFFQYNDLFEKNKIKILGHTENYKSESVFLKYKEKNLQYVYFEKEQYEVFIKLVYREIENELKSTHAVLDDDICLQLDGVQIIHEYLSLGHNFNELKSFSTQLASSILKTFKLNDSFEKIRLLILKHPHAPSQLAIMTSYLSCFLLQNSATSYHEDKFEHFIKAALFMDGSLEDEDLVMISNPDFEQYKKLSPSYQKLIDNHSFESGELFSKIFPNAVKEKVLIENHHGPQFNKNFHDFIKAGDEGNDICLFSLSQNLAQEILTKNLDIMSLKKNIKRFEEDHPSEKAIKSLKKLA
tara:strand:+ start:18576 stop:19934 length:1359 start_codon:yes stop_codon:yes gene_type:complete